MVAFSFLYDVFRIFVEAKNAGGASLLHTSSFIADEVNLLSFWVGLTYGVRIAASSLVF